MKFLLAFTLLFFSFSISGQSELEVKEPRSNRSFHPYLTTGHWTSYENDDIYYDFEDGIKVTLGVKMVTQSNWFVDANLGCVFIGNVFSGSDFFDNKYYIITKEQNSRLYNSYLAENLLTFNVSGGYRFKLVDKVHLDLSAGIDYNVLFGSEFDGFVVTNTIPESRNFRNVGLQVSAALSIDVGFLDVGIFARAYDAEWNRNDSFSSVMPSLFFETGVIICF